jgi:hypothetical protein
MYERPSSEACGHIRTALESGPIYEVDALLGCWVWRRARTRAGYPVMWKDGKTRLARRVFYEERKGPIPAGHRVVATCGNRLCVFHLDVRPG